MFRRGWRLWIGGALLGGGAALLGWSLWLRGEAALEQKQARDWLARSAPANPQTGRAPEPSALHQGDPVGELDVPRLHLSVMVMEGDDEHTLALGAGHIPGTALAPGTGNIGIAGHRDTFFRPLRLIRPDDLITLKTPAGVSHFRVTDTRVVSPDDVQTLDARPGRDLTLVTCYPFYYLGAAPKRFIVHARAVAG